MIRTLSSFAAVLAACAPSPQETAMRSRSPEAETTAGTSSRAVVESGPSGNVSSPAGRAALGPSQEAVSAADNPVPAMPTGLSEEAVGRRILSTAFVLVGPDGRLTVELRNGRVLVLRDVVMHRKNYCGVHVAGSEPGTRYCGQYSELAGARPGGPPTRSEPDLAVPNPIHSGG